MLVTNKLGGRERFLSNAVGVEPSDTRALFTDLAPELEIAQARCAVAGRTGDEFAAHRFAEVSVHIYVRVGCKFYLEGAVRGMSTRGKRISRVAQ